MPNWSAPSLNKNTRNHYIIARLSSVNQFIFKDNNSGSWNDTWLKSFVNFLNLDFLIIFVLSSTMNWQKIPAIALAHLHPLWQESSLSLLFSHCHKHIEEWIWSFLNLSSADWWKQELIEFINVWWCSVHFAAVSASEIFLGLSILDVASPNGSTLNDHELVDVTLS